MGGEFKDVKDLKNMFIFTMIGMIGIGFLLGGVAGALNFALGGLVFWGIIAFLYQWMKNIENSSPSDWDYVSCSHCGAPNKRGTTTCYRCGLRV